MFSRESLRASLASCHSLVCVESQLRGLSGWLFGVMGLYEWPCPENEWGDNSRQSGPSLVSVTELSDHRCCRGPPGGFELPHSFFLASLFLLLIFLLQKQYMFILETLENHLLPPLRENQSYHLGTQLQGSVSFL